jgi:hypothetical protein
MPVPLHGAPHDSKLHKSLDNGLRPQTPACRVTVSTAASGALSALEPPTKRLLYIEMTWDSVRSLVVAWRHTGPPLRHLMAFKSSIFRDHYRPASNRNHCRGCRSFRSYANKPTETEVPSMLSHRIRPCTASRSVSLACAQCLEAARRTLQASLRGAGPGYGRLPQGSSSPPAARSG